MDEQEKNKDELTGQAVDDIVQQESNQLLETQDEQVAAAEAEAEAHAPGRMRRFFHAWLGTSKGRWATFLVLVAAATTIGAVPRTRYALLNAAGVRASLSVHVYDKSTLQPLDGIKVSTQGATAQTDEEGFASLTGLRLGPSDLEVARPGFATFHQEVTIGWGSNPLDDIQLEPTGLQYVFRVVDYLSGQAINNARADVGEANAQADSRGIVTLTLENPEDKLTVTISAEGYRSEKLEIDPAQTDDMQVRLVPARKHAFLSNRTGTLDVYKIDIDGQNEQLVLRGTGTERGDTLLLPHPSSDIVALLSRRSNERDNQGRALNVLTIIDLKNNKTKAVSTSEHIQVLGWAGNRISYVMSVPGAAADNPERQRLMSYDFQSENNRELATANSFNAAVLTAGDVYYAPAAAYQNGINVSLFRASPDGSSSGVVFSQEVTNIVRTAYDQLAFLSGETWYDYRLGGQPAAGSAPSTLVSRRYLDNAKMTFSLWVEARSGQPTLLLHDPKNGQERALQAAPGLGYPISWLTGSVAVYRINTAGETADYAISTNGGEPQKIQNVTNVGAGF